MTDREKVIKGLERCVEKLDTVVNKTHGYNCTACPYFRKCDRSGYLNGLSLMRDALALLEAQEPRVMTLEEVITSKPGTVVWLEDFNKPDVISGLFKRLFIYTKVIDFLIEKEEVNNEVTADLDVYGSGWRCWTSRPTDEQREATPWN